jgi:P27 family predicted phage terminase small subunit
MAKAKRRKQPPPNLPRSTGRGTRRAKAGGAKKRVGSETQPTKRGGGVGRPAPNAETTTAAGSGDPRRAPDDLASHVEPLTAAPKAPARLGTYGRECWQRLAPLLVELKLIRAMDLEALEAMCHQWHEFLTWHLIILEDPERAIVEYGESGARQKSPEATLRDSAYDRWLKLLPRFGLSPEHLRKLTKLKPAASGRRVHTEDDPDPVANFARRKYES